MNDITERLRSSASGTIEWRVQNPETRAYCISFTEWNGGERSARQWLDEEIRARPESIFAKHEVARVAALDHRDRLMLEAADEIDRLRARVAELESQPADQFTAELVELDGHTYGLRPGAARVVREALADDPELDCTDFAKPAWWRGEAYGSSAAIAAVTRILDGKDDGRGVANEPWQSVRTRLREALRDAARLSHVEKFVHFEFHKHVDTDAPWVKVWSFAGPLAWMYTGDTFRSAIDAAMAKDGNDCTCSVVQAAHGHHAGCPAKDGAR